MKLSLTSFVLIAFITTSCVSNNNLNIQQSDKNTNLINGLNNEIATDDKLELERLIDKVLSYEDIDDDELVIINKYLIFLRKDIQTNVKTALREIEIFKESRSHKSIFNTNEKNKDLLIKLSLGSDYAFNFEFNSSGIFIDQNLQDSVHYGFCNSYSYDQRASIERIVFEDFESDGVLVIYNKNYKNYVSNLKQKFPTASFSELKSNDYDEFISKILNIKESKDRKNTLQGLDKNTNLVFLPRKNQNLKKIFIILDYKDAKAIVPILKSYVLDFPIFATNDLLYEIADPKKILDFEGLFFPLNSKTMSLFMEQDLKMTNLKDEFNKTILRELLLQEKLREADIKKSYIKTNLSDVEYNLNSCNRRTISISSAGDG